ncbi:MAG: hypothetical protein ABIE94_01820 [archaeon]
MKSNKEKIFFFILITIVSISLFALFTQATPRGPTITFKANSTQADIPVNRTDDGGTINVINLDITQQTGSWKAYVGNVSGSITLDDSDGHTIYDWSLTTITGEVYAARNGSITWTNVICANGSTIQGEEASLNLTGTEVYSINLTFNETGKHQSFIMAGKNITLGSCYSTATYVNSSHQRPISDTSFFEEVLLQDGDKLIYSTIIENDAWHYRDTNTSNETYDFQMIVGESEAQATPNRYFFWVELG